MNNCNQFWNHLDGSFSRDHVGQTSLHSFQHTSALVPSFRLNKLSPRSLACTQASPLFPTCTTAHTHLTSFKRLTKLPLLPMKANSQTWPSSPHLTSACLSSLTPRGVSSQVPDKHCATTKAALGGFIRTITEQLLRYIQVRKAKYKVGEQHAVTCVGHQRCVHAHTPQVGQNISA